jgi:hypothetical protein
MVIKKLNLGCGKDYREGFINLDSNKKIKADVYCDLEKKIPSCDNLFDYILIDNVLEHINNFTQLIDELYIISKDKAIIEIYVPHFTSIYAFKHLDHKRTFGAGSFDIYKTEERFTGEIIGEAKFEILDERLLYFHHNPRDYPFLAKIPINWMFNFSRFWRVACEKVLPLRFDEIYFKLQVIKKVERR